MKRILLTLLLAMLSCSAQATDPTQWGNFCLFSDSTSPTSNSYGHNHYALVRQYRLVIKEDAKFTNQCKRWFSWMLRNHPPLRGGTYVGHSLGKGQANETRWVEIGGGTTFIGEFLSSDSELDAVNKLKARCAEQWKYKSPDINKVECKFFVRNRDGGYSLLDGNRDSVSTGSAVDALMRGLSTNNGGASTGASRQAGNTARVNPPTNNGQQSGGVVYRCDDGKGKIHYFTSASRAEGERLCRLKRQSP